MIDIEENSFYNKNIPFYISTISMCINFRLIYFLCVKLNIIYRIDVHLHITLLYVLLHDKLYFGLVSQQVFEIYAYIYSGYY